MIEIFARGGGGGSGGGGGGGSGSGGGGGGSIIFLVGYVPTHFVTNYFYKRGDKVVAIIMGAITGGLITFLVGLVSPLLAFFVGISAVVGVKSGLGNWLGRVGKRIKLAKSVVTYAASKDPAWQEASLQQRVHDVFYDYQKDWSEFNFDHVKTYTTADYFEHNRLMLTAMRQMGRRNFVENPQLSTSNVVQAVDQADNLKDTFTTLIEAQAHDQLIDTATNQVIYTDDSAFAEYWTFDRDGANWQLAGIDQTTADPFRASDELKNFATNHGMYYSPDWGWLLLPQHGRLFGKANFKNSDINNHVIGEIQNTLFQLYTYVPYKAHERRANYLVGQINLGKTYGGIIIKRKSTLTLFDLVPKGYQRVKLEWPDFNKRYDVYATDMEKVTTFELLNPAYMAKLYDADLPLNIEVVDNVVYFYVLIQSAESNYESMLNILRLAYEELKK